MSSKVRLWLPQYWPAWLVLMLLKSLAVLPLRCQYAVGRKIGRLMWRFIPSRRHVIRRNIDACFADKSDAERETLFWKAYDALGEGIIEANFAWNASDARFYSNIQCRMEGWEHLQAAIDSGKGVMMLGGHFTVMELMARVFAKYVPFSAVYRKQNKALYEEIVTGGRLKYVDRMVDRNNLKAMVRILKMRKVLWYAPDQDFGADRSVFVDFMGVQTATLRGIAQLGSLGDAVILPAFFGKSDTDTGCYIGKFYPPIVYSKDIEKVVQQYSDDLTDFVRRYPQYYFWIHRRFKTRPEGEAAFY